MGELRMSRNKREGRYSGKINSYHVRSGNVGDCRGRVSPSAYLAQYDIDMKGAVQMSRIEKRNLKESGEVVSIDEIGLNYLGGAALDALGRKEFSMPRNGFETDYKYRVRLQKEKFRRACEAIDSEETRRVRNVIDIHIKIEPLPEFVEINIHPALCG